MTIQHHHVIAANPMTSSPAILGSESEAAPRVLPEKTIKETGTQIYGSISSFYNQTH